MNLRLLIQYFPWLLGLRIRLIVLGRVLAYPLRFLPGNSRTFGPPRKLHYAVHDVPGCKMTKLGAQYAVQRVKPVTNSRLVEAEFGRMPDPTVEEAYVAELPGGRYFGTGGGCLVVGDDGLVWTHSPTNYTFKLSLHHAFSRLWLPKPQRYRKVINLATRCAEANYWHWMMDCVPRCRLLAAAGVDTSDALWLIDHRRLPYQLETLQAFGIPEAAVLVPDARTHVEAETMIVPAYLNPVLTSETITYSGESLEFLRQTFLPPEGPEPPPSAPRAAERIYLSRGKGARSFANEEEVTAVLEREGFSVVHCEDLSVHEQAQVFAQARIVVALHGAGLTNVVFCQPGTTVVEIFAPDFIQPYYWTLSCQARLRYAAYCEDERRMGIEGFRYRRAEGTAVDLQQFKEFLRPLLTR
ncbi:MAG: glycosyltransferase family 61 protein [Chthoniobacter sp.]|uniref:glycosyltransferase family 61 protein n=1 Tax=Chthoniobacter sp. TaxID=2510640 RepID=UPI0032A2CBDD